MWAIGDLQGCLDPLITLLARLPRDARLVFIGDLVNRGPQSLACLRFVRKLVDQGRAVALLGNHDLHLLAAAHGIRGLHDDDTLQEILDAPDRDELLDWLRARPLAHVENGALFVHAGVLPPWTLQQTLELAGEVQHQLRGNNLTSFLSTMYGNQPDRWRDDLHGDSRWRCVINALTRVRFVRTDGSMDLKRKEGPPTESVDADDMPWFDHPQRATCDDVIIFGHWSALGFLDRPDVICLDSGCVWGRELTALHWPQRTVVRVPCGGLCQAD